MPGGQRLILYTSGRILSESAAVFLEGVYTGKGPRDDEGTRSAAVIAAYVCHYRILLMANIGMVILPPLEHA